MHELSIANSIIAIVEREVGEDELENVRTIQVKVGSLSNVVPDSLEFSFRAITAETKLRNAILVLQKVPFQLQCNVCGGVSSNEYGIAVCDSCGSSNTVVLSGTELDVVAIEVHGAQKETA